MDDALKCERCPREGETVRMRLRTRVNFGTGTPNAVENTLLCDNCALMDENVHDSLEMQ